MPDETKFENLREDVPVENENDGFWENVPDFEDGYIITSKVKGV